MGWGTDDMLVTALDNEQMAVLDACNEFHAFETLTLVDGLGQLFIQILYQYITVSGLKVSTERCEWRTFRPLSPARRTPSEYAHPPVQRTTDTPGRR